MPCNYMNMCMKQMFLKKIKNYMYGKTFFSMDLGMLTCNKQTF